jgi:hypothetical protein
VSLLGFETSTPICSNPQKKKKVEQREEEERTRYSFFLLCRCFFHLAPCFYLVVVLTLPRSGLSVKGVATGCCILL